MNGSGKFHERERRDWAIILIILLFGFLCVIVAGERAIRFSPRWKLDANMRSNLDPDGIFLTNRPANYFQPLDPSILTQPTWINVFLTPGIAFEPRTSVPASATSVPTNTPPSISRTPTTTQPSLTPTLPFIPPPTSTRRPPSTITPVPPTSTSNPPLPPISVDLGVTKTDGAAAYTPGLQVTYTVVVTNNGLNNVTGAVVSDAKPAQVTTWSWACASVVNAGGCDAVAGSAADFTDTVDIQNGGSITYTVTANIASSATGDLTNTALVSVPAGYTDPLPGNNSATDTDTPAFSADLSITKTDNSTDYVPNATKTYIITVTNTGPSDATGGNSATVTDIFSTNANIVPGSVSWTCSGTGGATCASGPVSGDISDTVSIPAGSSVTYTATIQVVSNPSGPLANTASVSSSIDPNTANNSATDTDTLITPDIPPSQITFPPDGDAYILAAGDSLTLSINLTANGDIGVWDLVYYEYPAGSGIWLDWIIVEISDGNNWYTVFNWGDNVRDQNTNMDYAILSIPVIPPTPEEVDQRDIAASDLYLSAFGYQTGIAIDIDALVPLGTYSYIRFTAPTGDVDGQTEIDSIEVLP